MIVILSSTGVADPVLSSTLANVSSAKFGARHTIGLYVPPLGPNQNLYIVASRATYKSSNAPAIGEDSSSAIGATIGAKPMSFGSLWTVQYLMYEL